LNKYEKQKYALSEECSFYNKKLILKLHNKYNCDDFVQIVNTEVEWRHWRPAVDVVSEYSTYSESQVIVDKDGQPLSSTKTTVRN